MANRILAVQALASCMRLSLSLKRVGEAALCLWLLPCGAAAWSGPTLTAFDPPDSTYTTPRAINALGVIVGNYISGSGTSSASHGFVRTAGGTIATIDPPNAASGTVALGINDSGTITGVYNDANLNTHGFLRSSAGDFVSFDVPGAGGTTPVSINAFGATVGYCVVNRILTESFIRDASGKFTIISIPGASSTFAQSINSSGLVAGQYTDSAGHHGFLFSPTGGITTFDAPGASHVATQGTIALSINYMGTIAGYYYDAKSVLHGFERSATGVVSTFEDSNAGTGSLKGTVPVFINGAGFITGPYYANGFVGGFIRTGSGNVNNFQAPPNLNTFPQAINTSGSVTGYFLDAAQVSHGFVVNRRTVADMAI